MRFRVHAMSEADCGKVLRKMRLFERVDDVLLGSLGKEVGSSPFSEELCANDCSEQIIVGEK